MKELYIASWLSPYVGAALVLLLHKVGNSRIKGGVAVLSILTSALISTAAAMEVYGGEHSVHVSYTWVKSLDVTIGVYFDALSSLMALVVSWLSFLIATYSLEYMGEDPGQTRYWFFFSFFVGSMMMLVLADNLIAMFIGWEGTGLASYSLIGHWYTDEEERWVGDPGRKALGMPMWFEPSHAGLRALVFTRLGDVGFIVGIAALHCLTGTTNLHVLLEKAGEWSYSLYATGILHVFLALFVMGALAKSAQIPFHEWLVTAMTGPTSVSALIHAATMVKAGVYFLLRMTPIFIAAQHALHHIEPLAAHVYTDFFYALALIGGLTAFVMGTMALVSRELKLILAFSTASQLGYMFLGTAAGALIGEALLGVFSGFSHLMSHAMFKASLFLAAGAVIHAVHSRFVDDMGGLARHMKTTFIAMTLAALSLVGLPPFMGFWSKDAVILVAMESKAFIPFVLGIITAGLTAAYSIRMIIRVFLYEPSKKSGHAHEPGLLMLMPYVILAAASLVLGVLWPLVEEGYLEFLGKATLGVEEAEVHVGVEPSLAVGTLTLVGFGIITVYYIYEFKKLKPYRLAEREPLFRAIHNFLYDRWYINSVYYIVIVGGFRKLSSTLYRAWDRSVVDYLYHNAIPAFFSKLSSGAKAWDRSVVDYLYHNAIPAFFSKLSSGIKATLELWIDEGFHVFLVEGVLAASSRIRRVQTGVLNHYILMLWLGFSVLAIIFLLMGV